MSKTRVFASVEGLTRTGPAEDSRVVLTRSLGQSWKHEQALGACQGYRSAAPPLTRSPPVDHSRYANTPRNPKPLVASSCDSAGSSFQRLTSASSSGVAAGVAVSSSRHRFLRLLRR